ncbi:MAG: TetR/AcrR family transcriptional regulator [Acidobacteria bacterium]|nr:MAG: TetR/AcrR family transcriptional regulator [Acidobacteriota bacterium]
MTAGGELHRDRILQAAAALIAERGYHGMSMRGLARATEKSLAAFYNYFASKEELLFALHRRAFERLIAGGERALEPSLQPVERLGMLIDQHVRFVVEQPHLMRVLVHEVGPLSAPRRRDLRRLKECYFAIGREVVRGVVEAGCDEPGAAGTWVGDDEIERLTYSLFGMLNWVYGWYRRQRHGRPGDVARSIRQLALCGLVAHCPHRRLRPLLAGLGSSPAPPSPAGDDGGLPS